MTPRVVVIDVSHFNRIRKKQQQANNHLGKILVTEGSTLSLLYI